MSRPRIPVRLLVPLVAFGLAAAAGAQYFGKNKVQWESFDFHVLGTERFDLYYYPEDNPAALDAARMAERWYERLARAFDHEFGRRQPIVLYNDHADFQQTDVTGGIIGEGTGGFTEPLKNRVVMPLTGLYAETDHVLGHELVHAFQFDLAASLSRGRETRVSLNRLPLWMVEGLAEYLSQGRQDPHTAMWLRDAVRRDELPDLREMHRDPRINPYQYGQAFWAYVAGRWGDVDALRLFAASLSVPAELAFEETLGATPEEVFEGWHEALEEAYRPVLEERGDLSSLGEPLISGEDGGARLNVGPALSPDGESLAFLSTRSLFTIDLYVADAATGEVEGRLFSASSNPHMDALRFVDSAGAWAPDGGQFAAVVFSEGTNRIAIVDRGARRAGRQLEIPGVGALSNPAWSPDGRWLAVSGMRDGVADLYLVDAESGESRQVTRDLAGDLQPSFSPDGSTLVFATEAGLDRDALSYGALGIGFLDLASGDVEVVSPFPGRKHLDPEYGPRGEVYFVSDPEGISDLFRLWPADGRVERLTALPTGVAGITANSPAITVARNGDVVFSVFRAGEYDLYRLTGAELDSRARAVDPSALGRDVAAVLPPDTPESESVVAEYLAEREAPGDPLAAGATLDEYEPRLSLDFVGPAAVGLFGDTNDFGVGGSLSLFFSDVLGDHQVGVALQGGSSTGNDFGALLGGQAIYLNRSRRLNWGAAAAHLPSTTAFTSISRQTVEIDGQLFTADVVEQVRQQIVADQALAIASYPLSRTRRVEVEGGYTYYSFDAEVERLVVVGNQIVERSERALPAPESLSLFSAEAAYVGDNSYFGLVSPVRGGRMRLAVDGTFGDLELNTVTADLRKYFFFRPVTLAVRGLHFGRYGTDAESSLLGSLYLGRETLVRGYSLGSIDLDECTPVPGTNRCPEFDRLVGSRLAVANVELRVPLFGVEGYGLFELPALPTELLAFVDAGVAWTRDESPELAFEEESLERVPVVSAGVGLRVLLLGALPIQAYYAIPFQRPERSGEFGVVIAPGF